ncbi:MAG: hypothetical protein FK734_01360 [Asgard group archaeon]|nr:hypothetical protein [Asgard group archaeon]
MFGIGLKSQKWITAARKTERETKNYSKNLYETWSRIIKIFEMDLAFFNESYPEKINEYENTLIYNEMMAFTKRLAQVQNLAFWGYYHSSLLELRFMLETTILSYYLDTQLPNTDHSEKIKLMQKHKGELWGERLRRRSYMYDKALGAEVDKVINAINVSIDEYLADKTIDTWKQKSLPFREQDFIECVHHTQNACVLIIKHFTKSFSGFTYNGEMTITHKDESQTETHQMEEEH